jgi:hypothetical protein
MTRIPPIKDERKPITLVVLDCMTPKELRFEITEWSHHEPKRVRRLSAEGLSPPRRQRLKRMSGQAAASRSNLRHWIAGIPPQQGHARWPQS